MSYKYLDLTGLSHFWDKIKAKIPTKTSQLTNDSNFNYSVEKASGTIDDLAAFTSGKPGITGSISLTKKESGIGSEIPAGWYNFFFSPHRTGNDEDNANYGTIIISPMTNSGKSWILRRSSSATTISEVKAIVTSSDLNDYVTLGTTQTITGAKTLNSTLTMSNINNATYTTSTTGNIIPSATGLGNPPWNKDLWHDHFALLRYHSIESKEVTNDGTTWNSSTLDISSMFLGKDSASVTVLAASNLAFRFVLKNSTFAYSGVSWFELGVAYSNPFSSFEVLIEFSADKSAWTTCHKSTIASNSSPFFLKNNTSFASDGYIRVTFTKKTNLTTGTVRVGCLKALCIRKGDQGLGSEYEYPYDWDINSNLLPISNNAKNLGADNRKWANVYATTFHGNATSATKATQDSDGNTITTTYYKASNPNGYTSNTGTVTSVAVKMNGSTKGTVTTSGTIDLGTVLTAHQDISGKQDKLTAGSNIQITNNTISATDTTYSSKTAASGGTAVSLVTTGEKYTWNNKQNALSSQTAYTSKGSATKVPQITTNSLGQVTRIAEVTITQPTVNNGTLTIQKNGTSVGTFTANQSGNSTANITVPTKTSDLANDNDFITSDDGTIINIVSLTKAGYEDLVTKTPNTLYNITNDYTASTIRSGTGTLSTTYISNAEFNHWERVGNVVSYAFTITAKGTWTTNNGFVSGLPKPAATIRFTGINHSRNVPMRFEILNDGQIRNAYSTITPSANNTLEGQITYITSDI